MKTILTLLLAVIGFGAMAQPLYVGRFTGNASGLTNAAPVSLLGSNNWFLATNAVAGSVSNDWVGSFTGDGVGLTNLPKLTVNGTNDYVYFDTGNSNVAIGVVGDTELIALGGAVDIAVATAFVDMYGSANVATDLGVGGNLTVTGTNTSDGLITMNLSPDETADPVWTNTLGVTVVFYVSVGATTNFTTIYNDAGGAIANAMLTGGPVGTAMVSTFIVPAGGVVSNSVAIGGKYHKL